MYVCRWVPLVQANADFYAELSTWHAMHEFSLLTGKWKFLIIIVSELGQLSGVAAILRFPLPEPDEDSDKNSDSDSDSWK